MSENAFAELADYFAAQAKIATDAIATHRAGCTATECEQCERWVCRGCGSEIPFPGPCSGCAASLAEKRWRAHATRGVPSKAKCAALDSDWLKALAGPENMSRAAASVRAVRCTFVGPAGSGKTSLAAAMFNAWCDVHARAGGRLPMFVRAYELARARRNASLGTEAPLIAAALTCPLLVVDELGGDPDVHASAVYEVIHERHASDLATWITTGVGPKELAARYGAGITRRVFEEVVGFRLGGRS